MEKDVDILVVNSQQLTANSQYLKAVVGKRLSEPQTTKHELVFRTMNFEL